MPTASRFTWVLSQTPKAGKLNLLLQNPAAFHVPPSVPQPLPFLLTRLSLYESIASTADSAPRPSWVLNRYSVCDTDIESLLLYVFDLCLDFDECGLGFCVEIALDVVGLGMKGGNDGCRIVSWINARVMLSSKRSQRNRVLSIA